MEDLDETSSTTTTVTISSISYPLENLPSAKLRQKSNEEKDNDCFIPNIPKNTFCTIHADKGEHRSKFRLMPYSRALHHKYSQANDKLAECIKRGGGLVVNDTDYPGQISSKGPYEIKILDVEFVRANIRETQMMVLPYDCFSSSFIWNQIYHRCNNTNADKKDADLNLYRVSPSAHVSYDANTIFQGAVTWEDIQPIPTDKLASTIRVKDVALQLFPEVLVCPEITRTRRLYTRHESQLLLDAICKLEGHARVMSINLFEDIVKDFLPARSSHSLKEHFHKTILPHVTANDGYYTIAQSDLEKFGNNQRKKLRARKQKAKQIIMEDESGDEQQPDRLLEA